MLWTIVLLLLTKFCAALTPTETIYQFPNGTWIENIAVRANGELLVTILTAPEVYSIQPDPKNPNPKLVHRFENFTGAIGITESKHDVFQVGVASLSPTQITPGSAALHEIDFNGSQKPRVRESLKLPDVTLPNGLAALNKNKIMVADSTKANVVVADLKAKTSKVAIDDPLFKVPTNATVRSGVNGLKLAGDILYFTSSSQNVFGRVKIDLKTGSAKGLASKIVNGLPPSTAYDDFALAKSGEAYLAASTGNFIERANVKTKDQEILSGRPGTLEISEPTSAAFGRHGNEDTLFVVTGGGTNDPQYGVVGAQVLAIKVGKAHRNH